ncbi:YlbF family regulator [Cytobacillus sp. S13-E01]|uniref:YlbF family regulator n=1 Tax=Cytobacillus sp. S13-E01 TaxID=3031326 RepID=UPI0023D84F30|nr:YlbF family regulator [Cytobacillus sp. S13-E01]MDF0726887.1 YlbF family regulator [Cytobacillus sp. S13-E01]
MAVNLFDVAYDVEKAIRESEEYKNLKSFYDEVNADESAKKMFENFRDVQLNLQQKQMMGQEISQEEVEQAQKMVALVQQHQSIAKLMEAEQSMSMAIGELNKIIMKPLEELYGSMEENK